MRTGTHGQLRTNYPPSKWRRCTLAGLSMALWSVTAVSATATLVNSPFKGMVTASSIQTATERTINVKGAKAGDSRTAMIGDSLLNLSYDPKAVMPSIEVVSDLTLTTGDATLNLKAGDKIFPETRLRDVSGRSFYLVLTDPKTSTFFKRSRYFAMAENGEVLDRAFSPLSDAYLPREEVKITDGSFTLNRAERTGQTQCSLSAVFLGLSEGTLKFKLIRTDASGAVNAEQMRSFAAGVRSVSLPGAQLTVTKVDTKSIKVHIDNLQPVDCLAGL